MFLGGPKISQAPRIGAALFAEDKEHVAEADLRNGFFPCPMILTPRSFDLLTAS